MLFTNAFAAGALLTVASAIPLSVHHNVHEHLHAKRDIEWVTTDIIEYKTEYITTTMFGAHTATQSADEFPNGLRHAHTAHRQLTHYVDHTVTVQPVPMTTQGFESMLTSAITSTQATPTEKIAGSSSPAETVATTKPAVGSPVATTSAAPSRAQTTSAPAAPSATGGSTPGGAKFSGDITYYTPGLGSCGITNSESDHIVALAEGMMEATNNGNPNTNPECGRSITISYGGKTAVATIEDTCPGCSGASLDLTPSLFEIFAPLGTGRVSGVDWWYN